MEIKLKLSEGEYDYGSHIKKIGLNLASLNQISIDPENEKWLWESKSGAQIFVEKFGHSQMWFFPDPDLLNL